MSTFWEFYAVDLFHYLLDTTTTAKKMEWTLEAPQKEMPKEKKFLKFFQLQLHSLIIIKVTKIKIELHNEPQTLKEKEKYQT